jgi:uncharacterized membrane protein YbhN (UPF0104 family)
MKNKVWIRLAVIAVVLLVIAYILYRVNFDWATFWNELRHANFKRIAIGIGIIYSTYLVRSIRWALFIRPAKKVGPFATLGPQFIGFTTFALFGRLADLARPYLIARKLDLPVSSQIAVYTIERMFDMAGAAIVIALPLAFPSQIASLPHHEYFWNASKVSFTVTLAAAVFLAVMRLAGEAVTVIAERVFGIASKSFGKTVGEKIREFRIGLGVLTSGTVLLTTLLLSILMWMMIAFAYVQVAHAFVQTPQLMGMTIFSATLLMATSILASAVQVPILGWFTQITALATALATLYGVPKEAATACGALLLLVTFLSVIPTGLIIAQVSNISLKKTVEAQDATRA